MAIELYSQDVFDDCRGFPTQYDCDPDGSYDDCDWIWHDDCGASGPDPYGDPPPTPPDSPDDGGSSQGGGCCVADAASVASGLYEQYIFDGCLDFTIQDYCDPDGSYDDCDWDHSCGASGDLGDPYGQEDAVCEDSTSWWTKKKKNTCAFKANKFGSAAWCDNVDKSGVSGRDACPMSCGVCPEVNCDYIEPTECTTECELTVLAANGCAGQLCASSPDGIGQCMDMLHSHLSAFVADGTCQQCCKPTAKMMDARCHDYAPPDKPDKCVNEKGWYYKKKKNTCKKLGKNADSAEKWCTNKKYKSPKTGTTALDACCACAKYRKDKDDSAGDCSCEDSKRWVKNKDKSKEKTCAWVKEMAEKGKDHCNDMGKELGPGKKKNVLAKDACPGACCNCGGTTGKASSASTKTIGDTIAKYKNKLAKSLKLAKKHLA